MASFVILILGLVAFVKSDIGYRYNVPITSYDVPFGSVGNLNNDRKYYHIEKQPLPTGEFVSVTPPSVLSSSILSTPSLLSTPSILSGSTILSTPSPLLQTPIHEHTLFSAVNNLPQQKLLVVTSHSDNNLVSNVPTVDHKQDVPIVNLLGSSQTKNIDSSENIVLDSKSSFAGDNTENVEVQKYLYFYAAPDEPEEVQTRFITPPPPVKKNVKILFIKTPTFNSAPITIPVLSQNEDKTLVYVLVKKPDEQTIVIPTAAPTKPAKPEVYFIKYKTQQEAHDAVSNIQDAHNTESGDINEHLNVYSRISSSGEDGSAIGQQPGGISTQSLPTALGESSGVQISDGQPGLSGIHTQVLPTLTPGRIFSSDAITRFDSSLAGDEPGFVSSTTVSPFNLPTAPTDISGRINVHQVYGPPRNRR